MRPAQEDIYYEALSLQTLLKPGRDAGNLSWGYKNATVTAPQPRHPPDPVCRRPL